MYKTANICMVQSDVKGMENSISYFFVGTLPGQGTTPAVTQTPSAALQALAEEEGLSLDYLESLSPAELAALQAAFDSGGLPKD